MGRKGESTKQHIRESAFKLFAEHGYSKVTMQEICDKCELSKGGLYRHYEDKCQIFTDILKSLQKEESDREEIGIKQDSSAIDIFSGFLEHVRYDLSKKDLNINIALYEFCVENKNGIGKQIISEQYQQGESVLVSLMEYGVSRNEFHLINPKAAASAILFLIEGMRMINEVMPISDKAIDDIFLQINEIVGIKNEI